MQTFTQICHELGYKSYHAGYEKLSRAGVELSSLPRFLGEDKRTIFYDDDTKEYLKSVIKPCNKKYQAAMLRRIEAKKAPVKMERHQPAEVQVSAPNPIQTKEKKKVAPAPAKSMAAASSDCENRLQQVKVLGDLLIQQIEMLGRDMNANSAATAS